MPPVQAANGANATSPVPPSSDTRTFAHAGDRIGDVAQRAGVDEQAMRLANPDLPNPDFLLEGQALNLPETLFSPAAAGVAGAMGRDASVHGLMDRAYQAGRTAPQEAFSGKVYRGVGAQAHETTAYDHRFGNVGRYNSATERLIYTSPDVHSAALEATPYAKPGESPMAGKSLIGGDFSATPDAEGRGGVANLRQGLQQAGLPVEALVDPKGARSPSLLYQLTGEHPYSLGQQAAKGAADAGATALRGPTATGAADQINIIPRNAHPSQLQARNLVRFDAAGIPGSPQPVGHIASMPANDKAFVDGPLDKRAGQRGGDSVANQGPEQPGKNALTRALQQANGGPEGYPRAGSGRYGAAGGALMSLGGDAVAAARGGHVDLSASAQAAGTNAAVGYGAARAADVLTPRIGLRGAGGAVAGVIEGALSTSANAQAYRRGEVSAARASANIAVDTGTAVGAGAAGAAAGAAIGSVVPVAGTAVGAVAGFVIGAAVYATVQYVGKHTGAIDAAKNRLTDTLASAEKPLGQALDKVGQGLDSAGRAAGTAWKAVKFW